ncbi:RNA polymerase sigma factor [Paenibacillus sp. sptzw28]|uniref:RNA polymerase sigma factor n=1 Tax=Paenibacillus sp. sptzw28 TaxID=715179 RepID=UPI001C6E62AE|nr:RNA polymerase sigma factor [Paenibacillus sp. sptzw28]QYR21286.1 RNA polymerase sigma factor [Paenibacillus sp. sptzw28]
MDCALTDSDLIDRARGGDRDAFGELVRRHRAKAFDWARNVARDPHLAEDIVQEALLRAFMHFGTLADMDRFLPWLHRIVRNEALMKLRKGENSGRERTFTGFRSAGGEANGVNWSDLDSILHYMCGQKDRTGEGGDPSVQLAHQEFLQTIRHLLRCLAVKERAVFEAHFFRELSPGEIARLFDTTTDNVYQSLARARQKIREERVRVRLREYVTERRDNGVPERAELPLRKGPRSGEWKRCKTSFAGAVYAVLPCVGQEGYTLTDVMGLTGQAFRLTIEEECIDVTGPTMYFWESKFRDGLLNLGLESEHAGDGGAPPSPFMLNKGIAHIRRSISRGMPVIAWDLFTPEFGIIYGYDDAKQLLYAEDARAKKAIPYDRFGRGASGGLFVLSITGQTPYSEWDYWDSVRNALDMIIRHAYGEMTFVGYVCGLAAYDCWKDAFNRRCVDPLGNAYTLEVAVDARKHAAEFVRGLGRKLTEEAGRTEAAAVAAEAAAQYEAAAASLGELSRLFPFPKGGSPNDPVMAASAVALLEQALNAEKAGVLSLERLHRCLGLMLEVTMGGR